MPFNTHTPHPHNPPPPTHTHPHPPPHTHTQALELDEPGGGAKMSLDKLLEELSATLSYVSEFLRRVPEETRMEACFAAKMENYKKDQTVYRIGDPPERFHLILTGALGGLHS